MQNAAINDPVFPAAVEAIDKGDIQTLQQLLESHPELITKRLDTPNEEGYFKDPYLLWFVAGNPIRDGTLPANIVEITTLLIDALQKTNSDHYQYIMDYTLGLVCTGRIPKECGVQIPLMNVLINKGARVKGSVLGAIGQHNFEAAKYLLDKGADYNLATAVGLDRWDDVQKLVQHATASELYVALVAASFFGKANMVSFLIEHGADVNGNGTKEDFGGFHAHASALHQAVYSGSLASVELLVNAGANLNTTDKVYTGTPLGWAMYMQGEEGNEVKKKSFAEIEMFLRKYGE